MKMTKQNKQGFYDIELALSESAAKPVLDLDDIFYLRNLQQRKLFLFEDINELSAEDITTNILQYNREDENNNTPKDKRKAIKLYISSPGGSTTAGFQIIDTIITSETPVYTINIGTWYSMAFLIGICGHKRYAMPSSTFLHHDGSTGFVDSQSKAEDIADFTKRYNKDIVKQHVLDYARGISESVYEEKRRVEWYMFAQDAKNMGCIDYIIGKDRPIYDII